MPAAEARITGRRPPASPALTLTTLCLAFFVVILDTTIVNVALPAIQAGLATTVTGLQWVVDGYTLVFAALLLSAGSVCDRLGAKRIFVAGLAAFTAGSAWCALAPSVDWLVAARLFQGLGAAMVLPPSLALLTTSFPDRAERARAVGLWAAVGGIATAVGPVAGGLLVHLDGWRLIFVVNVPIGAAGLLLARRYLAKTPRRSGEPLDLAGQALAIGALGTLTFALVQAGSLGWASPVVLGAAAASIVAACVFIVIEGRVRHPMLPRSLFETTTVSAANAVAVILNFGIYGQLFVLSLYFQHERGYSALATGLALLPFAAMTVPGPVVVGRLTARIGPRVPMVAGQACAAAGSLWLAFAGPHTDYGLLAPGLVALGVGFALTMPSMTVVGVGTAPAALAGTASGVLNTARQVGGAIGVALLGSLVARRASFDPGMHEAQIIVAAAFACGALVSARYVERLRRDPPRRNGRAPLPARGGGGQPP